MAARALRPIRLPTTSTSCVPPRSLSVICKRAPGARISSRSGKRSYGGPIATSELALRNRVPAFLTLIGSVMPSLSREKSTKVCSESRWSWISIPLTRSVSDSSTSRNRSSVTVAGNILVIGFSAEPTRLRCASVLVKPTSLARCNSSRLPLNVGSPCSYAILTASSVDPPEPTARRPHASATASHLAEGIVDSKASTAVVPLAETNS
jgi:hypothetical protein